MLSPNSEEGGGKIKVTEGGFKSNFLKRKAELDAKHDAKKGGKKKVRGKDEPVEGSLNIVDLNPDKPLIETDTPLEFLLVSISKAFKITPK